MALTVMPRYRPAGSPVRPRSSARAPSAARHQPSGSNWPWSAAAATLAEAADVAEATETLAGLYCRALAIGRPNVLTEEQMAEVLVKYEAKARS